MHLVNIWVDIIFKVIKTQDSILAIGDSTSVLGWLRRSNFRETNDGDVESSIDWLVKQQVARKLAELVLQAEAVLYGHHLPRRHNVVTDSLSKDSHFYH